MKPTFDSLLAAYGENEVPELPGAFAENVLRDIRQRKSAPEPVRSFWAEILGHAFRPTLLAASLSLAVAIGVSAPFFLRPPETSLSVRGLDLGVFSSSARNLPSGLLAHTP